MAQSAGAIAFEMPAGDVPFGRGSVVEIVMRRRRNTPPRVACGVRPAMTLDPQEQFETAAAFAAAIETISPRAVRGGA